MNWKSLTDQALSIRLHIRPGLFVHIFYSERSHSLYFALVEGTRRLFGVDRENNE